MKPANNLTVTVDPEELLGTRVYFHKDGKVIKGKGEIHHFIAQSIWGRMMEKLPDKVEGYPIKTITVEWDKEERKYEITFWKE